MENTKKEFEVEKIVKIVKDICLTVSIIVGIFKAVGFLEVKTKTEELKNKELEISYTLSKVYEAEVEKTMSEIREIDKKMEKELYVNSYGWEKYATIKKEKLRNLELLKNSLIDSMKIEKNYK